MQQWGRAAASLLIWATGCPQTTPGAACEGVTCSWHGTCEVRGGGRVCVCDDGYVASGRDCLPVGADGDADADDAGDADDAEDAEVDVGPECGNGVVEPPEECDDFPPPTRACSTFCGSTGSEMCALGCRWSGRCEPPVESCSGVDDDCDTAADEDFPCRMGTTVPCTTTCSSTGSGTCTAACAAPAAVDCTPPAETCNGVDDDCDGATDEGCGCTAVLSVPSASAPCGMTFGEGDLWFTNEVPSGQVYQVSRSDGSLVSSFAVPAGERKRTRDRLSGARRISAASTGGTGRPGAAPRFPAATPATQCSRSRKPTPGHRAATRRSPGRTCCAGTGRLGRSSTTTTTATT